MDSQSKNSVKKSVFSWGRLPVILTTLLALLTLLSIFLYAFGQAAEQSYLEAFGLDQKWFDLSKDMKIYRGFNLLLNKIISGVFTILIPVIALSVISTTYSETKNPNGTFKNGFLHKLIRKLNETLIAMTCESSTLSRKIIGNAIAVSISSILFLILVLFAVGLIAYPIQEGVRYGKLKAIGYISFIHDGRDNGNIKLVPIIIKKDGVLVASGHPVAYGENHIAIYNKETRTVHTFSTDGIEITRAFPKKPPSELPPPGNYRDSEATKNHSSKSLEVPKISNILPHPNVIPPANFPTVVKPHSPADKQTP